MIPIRSAVAAPLARTAYECRANETESETERECRVCLSLKRSVVWSAGESNESARELE